MQEPHGGCHSAWEARPRLLRPHAAKGVSSRLVADLLGRVYAFSRAGGRSTSHSSIDYPH